MSGWTSQIQPFHDRPDIKRTIVWYAVPQGTPPAPPSFVFPNWNDDRDNFYPINIGNVPHTMKPYFGPVPAPGLSDQVGTDDQFLNGLSYADYLASGGSPATPCQVLPLGAPKVKAASRTAVGLTIATGCRQQGSPCPGLLIPCAITALVKVGSTTRYAGPMTFTRAGNVWRSNTFSYPPHGTVRLQLADAGGGNWSVVIGLSTCTVSSASCAPFLVQATDPATAGSSIQIAF